MLDAVCVCVSTCVCVYACMCHRYAVNKNYEEKTKKQQQPNHPQNPKQTMSMNCLEKQQHIHPTDIMVYGGKIVSKINYNNTVAHRL